MDRNTALSALIDLRQIFIEESKPKIAEALGVAIEALRESTDKYTNATTNLYDSRLAKDLLGISEEAKKLRMFDGDAESATTTDCISRQAAIEAVCKLQKYDLDERNRLGIYAPWHGAKRIFVETEAIYKTIYTLPPVEPKPVCEDAIRCYEFLKERIGSDITDNAEEFEKWFERMVWHVQKCNEHDTEMRNVSEDTISKHDLWRIIEDNAYWITYNETSREKGMTLTGINQALNECPPVEPKRPKRTEAIMVDGEPTEIDPLSYEVGYSHGQSERPKGEWVEYISDENGARYGRCTSCNKSTLNVVSYDLNGQRYTMDFCPKCGADMRGEEDD